jgi:DNA-directed RNA polymerase subunit beta
MTFTFNSVLFDMRESGLECLDNEYMACDSLFSDIRLGADFAYNDGVKLSSMIENQKQSYMNFLHGLGSLFENYFPISNHNGTIKLEFLDYMIEKSKMTEDICIDYSITLSVILKVKLRLTISGGVTGDDGKVNLIVKEVKDQWIFFADIPLMSDDSSFLINGCKYVVISQMHRSPGVFFDHDDGKNHSNGKFLYSASLIPSRGSWLDLEFDAKDVIYFRVDKKRKIPVPTLLRACGLSKKEILDSFYKEFSCNLNYKSGLFGESEANDYVILNFNEEIFSETKLNFDFHDLKKPENILFSTGLRFDKRQIRKVKEYLNEDGNGQFLVKIDKINGMALSRDVYAGEIKIASCGDAVTYEILNRCKSMGIYDLHFYLIDYYQYNPYILDSVRIDKNTSTERALIEICRIFRGSDTNIDYGVASDIFKNIFFVPEKYDLSIVGRIKLNDKLGFDKKNESTVLSLEDILGIIKELIRVKDGFSNIDDIDHLSNRRVRSIGELVENQMKSALVKLVKNAVDKISSSEIEDLTPYDLVYSKFVSSAIREFFTLSQFSQFMDQTNPLSEIAHKRRISALGIGGLNRDRAGFEVRDVHFTHYGRICPIETPEGANIGLINSLAVFSKIDEHGFIRTPYRRVKNGVVTGEVDYLIASDEFEKNIAEINSHMDENGRLTGEKINCRCYGEFVAVSPEEVDYIDISSKQLVSVATSMIPFLDNDEAGRALMGANMQRQAVPLLRPRPPIVGTGMEGVTAFNSGAALIAKRDGVVQYVDAKTIIIQYDDGEEDDTVLEKIEVFHLKKNRKSNFNTCINQTPIVKLGQRVSKGQMISEGFATKDGKLSLGDNILIAFLSWNGYNFEDSIIVSERIIQEDIFTSVHLEEFECVVRDTRLGEERITRDIQNVSEDVLIKLDENGLIAIGTEIRPGDILVGKVMPKVDVSTTPEEKLLRAVFGESTIDVADASLYVPPGITGVVADIKILSRRGLQKDYISTMNDRKVIDSILAEMATMKAILAKNFRSALLASHDGIKIKSINKSYESLSGQKLTKQLLDEIKDEDLQSITLDKVKIDDMKRDFASALARVEKKYMGMIDDVTEVFGVELAHGVLKIVKVIIATKSTLQPGDKMSGRHGNKGVVSIVSPIEDMPYLEDGTPIDIVLSPLGIPSRMNIGQVLEVHLGLAIFMLNRKLKELIKKKGDEWIEKTKNLMRQIYHRQPQIVAQIDSMTENELIEFGLALDKKVSSVSVPVFSNTKDEEISDLLKLADCDVSGQCDLYDGISGEKIHRKVTVGVMYLLKLHHLVDNKIHARSIGPYSLVTQQPLGGRSHFGGQRFGEMECWALQAYGAAYTLQEMLTVKSDDVMGRVAMYDAIIKGENITNYGIPESFNVIVKELMALCINVEFVDNK